MAFDLYTTLKFFHILFAIIGLGSTSTFGPLIAHARKDPRTLLSTLRGIHVVNERIATPAYVLLLLTGLTLVWRGEWSWTTPWILSALVLYILAVLAAMFGHRPTLKRQIALLESGAGPTPEVAALGRRSALLGITTMLLTLAILLLMVYRPDF